jgi:hypothetical protein
MHLIVYDVLYSLNSHQHVLATIAAIFRVMLLSQEYKSFNQYTTPSTHDLYNGLNSPHHYIKHHSTQTTQLVHPKILIINHF